MMSTELSLAEIVKSCLYAILWGNSHPTVREMAGTASQVRGLELGAVQHSCICSARWKEAQPSVDKTQSELRSCLD